MSTISKILDKLLLMENIFCVYRNYSTMSRRTKLLVILRIFIEIFLTISVTIKNINDLLSGMYGDPNAFARIPVTFQIISLSNSFSMIFLGLYYSRNFASLARNIHYVHSVNFCENRVKYMMKNIKRVWFAQGIFFILTRSLLNGLVIEGLVNHSHETHIFFGGILLGAFYATWVQSRWLTEFVVFFSLIYIVGSLFDVLNESVDKKLKDLEVNLRIARENVSVVRNVIELNMIKEWAVNYRYLANGCKQLAICFSKQIITSFSISFCYSMVLSYRLINMLVKKENYDFFGGQQMVFTLCYQIVGILPIMLAGQRLNNKFVTLRRTVAKMTNLLATVSDTSEYRKVKDFLHLLTLDPLEFKLLSYPIGMAMLPTSFGVIVSYVVIALQFNHVV